VNHYADHYVHKNPNLVVLEYMETPLSQKHHVSAQEMVMIASQMMDGIAFLHEHGLPHGDIHENNIWTTPEGPPHIAQRIVSSNRCSRRPASPPAQAPPLQAWHAGAEGLSGATSAPLTCCCANFLSSVSLVSSTLPSPPSPNLVRIKPY